MIRYTFIISVLIFTFSCKSYSKNIEIPIVLDSQCPTPEISVNISNDKPSKIQIEDGANDGTRMVHAKIYCDNKLLLIKARFNSNTREEEYLGINYGDEWKSIYKEFGDSWGTGYLSFYGIDSNFIYYSITTLDFSDFFLNTVSTWKYKYNWRNGVITEWE